MKIVNNKNILLAVPSDFEINIRIQNELKKMGFKVYLYHYEFTWKVPFKHIIIHNYYKIFKRDRSYKTNIRPVVNKKREKKYQKKFLDLPQLDYSLIIRPDNYPIDFLKQINNKSKVTAVYQWDGMNRFPEVKKLVDIFGRFFIFDKNDLKEFPNTIPLTNFYFEEDKLPKTEQDIFFIGSYLPERMDLINTIAKRFNQIGFKSNINILCPHKEILNKKDEYHFNLIEKAYTFKENHMNILKSNYILDLANPIHNGLSFRSFESLGYRKKLITNNILVKKYDFYHPDNIFVFEDEKMVGLEEFIKKPYKTLSPEIYEKYSFSNWIKYVLNIPPFIQINLP